MRMIALSINWIYPPTTLFTVRKLQYRTPLLLLGNGLDNAKQHKGVIMTKYTSKILIMLTLIKGS
jgi:hypothetical protein